MPLSPQCDFEAVDLNLAESVCTSPVQEQCASRTLKYQSGGAGKREQEGKGGGWLCTYRDRPVANGADNKLQWQKVKHGDTD